MAQSERRGLRIVNPTDPRQALLEKAIDYFVEHGIGNTSLRSLAAAIGTSHRMLIYHFGSREGLLTEMLRHVQEAQRATLDKVSLANPADTQGNAWAFWTAIADAGAMTPLLFELSAAAMHGEPWAQTFRDGLEAWIEVLGGYLGTVGVAPEEAETLARLGMAVVRGATWELAITGDREAADRTVRAFLDAVWPGGSVA